MTDQPAAQPPLPTGGVSPEPAAQFQQAPPKKNGLLWLWITLGVLLVIGIAAALTYRYHFHASIRPTNLKEQELVVLNEKLEAIEEASASAADGGVSDGVLVETNRVRVLPPAQQEELSKPVEADPRLLVLTQRELNGMLNHNTDLGERLKIDLKPGYFDIQLVQPIDEQVAIFGGKTLRMSLDFSLGKVEGGDLRLTVRDVNIAGVPLPATWLEMVGIQKNANLLETVGDQYPWFEKFVSGIQYIDISSGEMKVKLAE